MHNNARLLLLGFAGGLRDRDTGFVRFGRRDYDPGIGRFVAQDPAGDTGGDHDLQSKT
ncbi:MAG: RHS repeat-associated core domain-containing protein [Thermodesulfobacteriota bacterium]